MTARLLCFKTQEAYYSKILEKYIQLWTPAGCRYSIDRAFTSLALNSIDTNDSVPFVPTSFDEFQSLKDLPRINELPNIMLAMRKIREAIIASSRRDTFARRAYIFIIRAMIITKHIESYHPTLIYLLRELHPCSPMTASEQHEFVGYYILDLACRQGDLAAAYQVRNSYRYKDPRIEKLLRSLVLDNWFGFWEIQKLVDSYQKRLVELGDAGMTRKAVNCLSRSYLNAEKAHVERVAGMSWEQLKKQYNVKWELHEDMVIIR